MVKRRKSELQSATRYAIIKITILIGNITRIMEVKHLNTIQYLCHKYESVGCNLYTIKNLLESNENLQIRLIGKNLGGGRQRNKRN